MDLYKDDFFTGLDGACKLRFDARTDQIKFHYGQMGQMRPRNTENWIKMLWGVVRYEAKSQKIIAGLLFDGPLQGYGFVGVGFGM